MQAEQQSERERFEAWCKQDNPRYEPTDDSPLNRRDRKVWQAHAALIEARAVARTREECAQQCDDMVLYTGLDCAAAIRAMGERT